MLTPERIKELSDRHLRAIEAEVRKDDEALIRQMESALSWSSPHADAAHGWKSENWARKRSEAITAARGLRQRRPLPDRHTHPINSPAHAEFTFFFQDAP